MFDGSLATSEHLETSLSGKYPQIANILIENEIMQPIECVDVALLNIKFEMIYMYLICKCQKLFLKWVF